MDGHRFDRFPLRYHNNYAEYRKKKDGETRMEMSVLLFLCLTIQQYSILIITITVDGDDEFSWFVPLTLLATSVW